MIKAVIFDFFGVLATEGVTSFNKDFFAGDKEKLKQIDQLVDKLNMATLGYNDFVAKVAQLAGVNEQIVREYMDVNHPNRPLLDYIRTALKPHYKLGIISNAGGNWVEEILGNNDAVMFDDVVLSHKVGFAKPQAEIYEIALDKLGLKAAECVFIDDIERYCDAARGLGMRVIHYQDFEQMKTELEKILATVADN
ncbi:MAG TPA: HAD family phosphatase [Candidatus Nitrosopolaris sp.]|nr:HAD family phosphatase [Candidatus Nitrosopolaris sp.]